MLVQQYANREETVMPRKQKNYVARVLAVVVMLGIIFGSVIARTPVDDAAPAAARAATPAPR